jgi:hypothetical protein
METCSICLEPLKDNIFKLSCNHIIHLKCYKKLMNRDCFFISCPLCRDMNSNKPDLSQLSDSDKMWFFCKKQRCRGINKYGKKCKKNCVPLNYGYCNHHHKNVLKKEDYGLMSDYMQYLYTLDITYYSRLVLIDWGKKMIINNHIKNRNVQELMEKYNMFISYFKKSHNFENNIVPFNWIYMFYGVNRPRLEWNNECNSNREII